MDGYKFFRGDRWSRRDSGVFLCLRDCFDCTEIRDNDDKVECLWVKTRRKVSRLDVLVGIYYKPLNENAQKIRRANLEPKLAATIKNNKKSFYKSIGNKRRAKKRFHSLLDAGSSIVSGDEEKAEELNVFITSVFYTKTSCPQDIQLWKLEVSDSKLSEAPITQQEMVRETNYASYTPTTPRWDGRPPREMR